MMNTMRSLPCTTAAALLIVATVGAACSQSQPAAYARTASIQAPADTDLRTLQPTPVQDTAVHKDVPFVPTPPEVVNRMLALAKPTSRDKLYDLGSGDGRIVIAAAKRYGTHGVGIDIDPERIREARHNADTAGVSKLVQFRQGNLFDVDLRDANIVTLYLLPEVNMKLRPKLLEQLRPGTRVVSHAFDMGDWKPDSTVTVKHSSGEATVYLWVITQRSKAQSRDNDRR
jgi:SAM-dependent methyltransferase